MNALLARTGRPAGEDRRRGRLGAGPPGRHRAGRAALPAGGCRRHHAVRRRAAARRAVQAAAGKARPAAAGRADQPSGRRKRRLAGAHAARLCRHRDGRHPRPLLPGQRHRTGSWRSSAAAAIRSRATTPPGWNRSASGCSRRRRRKAPASAPWRWSRNGSRRRRGRGRRRTGRASSATRSCWRSRRNR